MAADLPLGHDDGLPMSDVGAWAESKYRLFHLYATLFSTGMKNKWGDRTYVDLYAASGFARVRNTQRILFGSPLLALSVTDPFDRYVFCEQQTILLDALKQRVRRLAPNAKVSYIEGDCNEKVNDVLAAIPVGSRDHTVLSLCFVDPFDIGIEFETIRKLSKRYIDFLCLLALYMDANRNYFNYVREESSKVDKFLGRTDWRQNWQRAQEQRLSFPKFLAGEFASSMAALGYIPPPYYKMREVRSDEKNLPLYHLALFSRNNRAYDYWDEVLKYSTDQIDLGFED